jgi:hypothetical protein
MIDIMREIDAGTSLRTLVTICQADTKERLRRVHGRRRRRFIIRQFFYCLVLPFMNPTFFLALAVFIGGCWYAGYLIWERLFPIYRQTYIDIFQFLMTQGW